MAQLVESRATSMDITMVVGGNVPRNGGARNCFVVEIFKRLILNAGQFCKLLENIGAGDGDAIKS